jgi:predicted RNA-binding Zn-ribbon protein involved in translation (DUF1610 family)
MAGMSTYPFKCDLCGGVTELAPTYGDFKCQHCGQVYVYDECHRIELSEQQLKTLRDSRWIAVDEQWPKHGSDVLVAYKAGEHVLLGVGEFDGTTVNDDGATVPYFKGIGGFEATHWMPLPEPPEVK